LGERVPRVSIALATVAVAVGPTGIVIAVSPVLIRGVPLVPWTAAERPCIIVTSVARPRSVVARVVITIALARVAAASAAWQVGVPLIIAGVVVPRIEVEHAPLR
jgi:hypothetical protein